MIFEDDRIQDLKDRLANEETLTAETFEEFVKLMKITNQKKDNGYIEVKIGEKATLNVNLS